MWPHATMWSAEGIPVCLNQKISEPIIIKLMHDKKKIVAFMAHKSDCNVTHIDLNTPCPISCVKDHKLWFPPPQPDKYSIIISMLN